MSFILEEKERKGRDLNNSCKSILLFKSLSFPLFSSKIKTHKRILSGVPKNPPI